MIITYDLEPDFDNKDVRMMLTIECRVTKVISDGPGDVRDKVMNRLDECMSEAQKMYINVLFDKEVRE